MATSELHQCTRTAEPWSSTRWARSASWTWSATGSYWQNAKRLGRGAQCCKGVDRWLEAASPFHTSQSESHRTLAVFDGDNGMADFTVVWMCSCQPSSSSTPVPFWSSSNGSSSGVASFRPWGASGAVARSDALHSARHPGGSHVELWTGPCCGDRGNRREPCGACAQPMDNAHALPTTTPSNSHPHRLTPFIDQAHLWIGKCSECAN